MDEGLPEADHEYKELKKIKTECGEWIHMATILMDELRSVEMTRLSGEGLPTPLDVRRPVDSRMDSQTPAFTPGMPDRGEVRGMEGWGRGIQIDRYRDIMGWTKIAAELLGYEKKCKDVMKI